MARAALRIVLMYLAVVGVALAAGAEVEAPGGKEKVINFRTLSEVSDVSCDFPPSISNLLEYSLRGKSPSLALAFTLSTCC
jgi:hypothetical protein